tara:strand:+ start:213 stop:668 length:456 start_codon:yes stop_codon:yes gene_type:complete
MKKIISFVAVSALLGFVAMGSIATADDVVPGSYVQHDGSVMGVGQTMMQMGARSRALTNAVNLASGAGKSRSSVSYTGVGYQFGSSQSEQSWKAAKTVEDAGVVVGLVPGDCRGDNSDDSYRKQMNQNRNGYMKENLVSQSQCDGYHPTIK